MTAICLPQAWTWEDVLRRLEARLDLESSSRTTGAHQRRQVVTNGGQLLRLVLAYVLSGLSFRSTAAWAEADEHASFSDVALLNCMRRCGPWLRYLMSTLMRSTSPQPSPDNERRIVAVDATMICVPGDKQNYYLLHTAYDVTAQWFHSTDLTDRHTAERLDVGKIERDEIRLSDRAYACWRDLWTIIEASADYVVRLSATALELYAVSGEPIRRAVWCKLAETAGVQDVMLAIHATKGAAQMLARLIVLPLSEEKAAARRLMCKSACEWGYTPSQDALVTAGCLILITSLPREAWPVERVHTLYRRRWQVELAVKRLKSLIGLEDLRVHDSELVGVWIHTILLVALLIDNERPTLHRERPVSPRWAPRVGSQFRAGNSSLCYASL